MLQCFCNIGSQECSTWTCPTDPFTTPGGPEAVRQNLAGRRGIGQGVAEGARADWWSAPGFRSG
eukprot:4082032-Pyramimonas_sp.AAC.1